MFEWLLGENEPGEAGLQQMRAEFSQMLDDGRHVFCTAANALLGGTDPEVIREELFSIDKRINRAERQIRRQLVVHVSVHGATDISPCLVLMSVVKDAERVGDNAKNLFDLAIMAPRVSAGEHRDSLVGLKDRISEIMASCRQSFDMVDSEEATRVIVEAKKIEDLCDDKVRELVQNGGHSELAPAYVLAYRYFKRISAHVRNIASSVVQPIHKLDFTSKITLGEDSDQNSEQSEQAE